MPTPAPLLLERGDEIDRLSAVVEDVAAGVGRGVRVLGPAGVGKTTLLRCLTTFARERGIRVWSTTAGQLDSKVPYGVVRRLLDQPVRSLSTEDRARLDHSPARLSLDRLWGAPADATDGGPAQGDVAHSLGWLLEEIAADGALVLAVDDAQWADEESLLFLNSMHSQVGEQPVVVAVAARDEITNRGPALAALIADRDALVLRLDALSVNGTSALLDRRWGTVEPEIATAVADVTGGNPFLVLALTEALCDQADALTPEAVHSAVPDTVTDLVTARLAGRPVVERALAEAVAVLTSGTLQTAATLAEVSIDEAAVAADRLRDAGLFDAGVEFRYRHALLRAAGYALIGPSRREGLHRAAARLLEAEGSADAAVAHLLMTTGTADPWATTLLRRTAAEALAKGAPHTAVALLQRAVDEPPPTGDLPAVLHDLGLAQMRAYDSGCVDTLSRVIDTATSPDLRTSGSVALAQAFSFAGLHSQAADVLDAARSSGDTEHRLALDARWIAAGLLVPELVPAARGLASSYAALPGDSADERLMIIQQLAIAAGTNQPAETIRAFARRAIGSWDSPEQSPETTEWVWPRLFLAMIGDYDDVRRMADAGLAEATTSGSVIGLVSAGFLRAFTDLHSGRLPDAEDHYRAMLEHGGSLGGGVLVETLGCGGLAQTLTLQGHTAEAVELLAGFPEILPPDAPMNGAATVYFARGVTRQQTGDHRGALAAAEQLGQLVVELDVDSPSWAAWRALAVEPLRSLGRIDEARQRAAEHLELCEQGQVPHLIGEALCLSGLVAADPAEAIDRLRRSVEILGTTTSRWRHGTAALRLGAALRRSGQKAEAREHLQTAIGLLSECGAGPAAAEARAELAATGVRLRPDGDPARLTPSEQRIAELALDGLGNRDIALRLHVTRKTVETHLSSVYRKLGITGRDQLDGTAVGSSGAGAHG